MLVWTFTFVLASCGSTSNETSGESESNETQISSSEKDEKGKLTIAWLPNESGADVKDAREEIGKVIEEVTGKKVEHQTTTDYIIAIEAIANGNADIAFLGAQGYIEAHNKNEKVLPLVVPSGASGTLDDAVY
jgi:phosphonate transport system substrate-binding protein